MIPITAWLSVLALEKKRPASDRPIARRTDDQDSCARRRFGQSCRTDAYARTADRCGPNHVTEVASEFIFRQ
jgi:hypothetical protein